MLLSEPAEIVACEIDFIMPSFECDTFMVSERRMKKVVVIYIYM